jgi:hypothetical protein
MKVVYFGTFKKEPQRINNILFNADFNEKNGSKSYQKVIG